MENMTAKSKKERHRLILTGCGATGSKLVCQVMERLKDGVTDGQAEIVSHFLDTSRANEVRIRETGGTLTRIEGKKSSDKDLDGSGGERTTNVQPIKEGTKAYLDKQGYVEDVRTETHMVLFSLSGGSGSVIGPMVVKELLDKNIPVVAIVVGDSKDLISSNNTLKSLQGLANIARVTKSSLTMSYFNNADYEGNEYSQWEEVNEFIETMIVAFSIFTSGRNEDLDSKDMANLLNPSNYKPIGGIEIPVGVYFLNLFSGEVPEEKKDKVLISRSVTDGKTTVEGGSGLHHQNATVIEDDTLSTYGEFLPLMLANLSGELSDTMDDLNRRVTEMTDKALMITVDEEGAFSNNDDADEDGLVF